MNSVENMEQSLKDELQAKQTLDFASFSQSFFDTVSTSDAVTQNFVLSKMAFFQKRYQKKTCSSNSAETVKFIEQNKANFVCYDVSGEESTEAYGDKSEGFVYQQFPGTDFRTNGRSYTTENGYYMFLDTANFTTTQTKLAEKLKAGWVDQYTNYVGIVMNLYQPNFDLLLVIITIYDYRFGYSILVQLLLTQSDISTRSTVMSAYFFSTFDFILIGYMFVGCIVSQVIVYFELFWVVKKWTPADVEKLLKQTNPELGEQPLTRVKIWINKDKKQTRIFIKPNFFQIISK